MTPTTADPIKICHYKGCGKTISSPFNLCEDCRAIENRNIWTLLTDPETPPQFRQAGINKLLTQMTGPEAIARTTMMEETYLAFKKVMHQFGISENTKRVQRTLGEEVTEAHIRQVNVESEHKRAKKKGKRKESLAGLLLKGSPEVRRRWLATHPDKLEPTEADLNKFAEQMADEWMNEDLGL